MIEFNLKYKQIRAEKVEHYLNQMRIIGKAYIVHIIETDHFNFVSCTLYPFLILLLSSVTVLIITAIGVTAHIIA